MLNSGLCFCFLLKWVYKHQRQNAPTRTDGLMCYFICHFFVVVRGTLQSWAAGIAGVKLEELSWAESKPLSCKAEAQCFSFLKRKLGRHRNHPLLVDDTGTVGEKNWMARNLVPQMMEGHNIICHIHGGE